MLVQRHFVDDRRIRIVSDISYDVCERFRYLGREIYILHEDLIDIHERLFRKTMEIYSLSVDLIHSFKDGFRFTGLYQFKKILNQYL